MMMLMVIVDDMYVHCSVVSTFSKNCFAADAHDELNLFAKTITTPFYCFTTILLFFLFYRLNKRQLRALFFVEDRMLCGISIATRLDSLIM